MQARHWMNFPNRIAPSLSRYTIPRGFRRAANRGPRHILLDRVASKYFLQSPSSKRMGGAGKYQSMPERRCWPSLPEGKGPHGPLVFALQGYEWGSSHKTVFPSGPLLPSLAPSLWLLESGVAAVWRWSPSCEWRPGILWSWGPSGYRARRGYPWPATAKNSMTCHDTMALATVLRTRAIRQSQSREITGANRLGASCLPSASESRRFLRSSEYRSQVRFGTPTL